MNTDTGEEISKWMTKHANAKMKRTPSKQKRKTKIRTRKASFVFDVTNWPNCIVPGCENKCCARLNSERCWPHTMIKELTDRFFFSDFPLPGTNIKPPRRNK